MSASAEPAPQPRYRAGGALALTILAIVLAIFAYVLVGLGKKGHVPVQLPLYGGIFIVGSNPTPDAASIKASIYRIERNHLVRLASLNDGSEIDALVARTYRVTESTATPSKGVARHAHRS